jgi:hypothetical protein
MKKIPLWTLTAMLLLSAIPFSIQADKKPVATTNNATTSAEAKVMLNRLEEINALDKSNLRAPEKRALRKEVRAIEKNLSTSNGGVYLSVGAVIIIILLLILLL